MNSTQFDIYEKNHNLQDLPTNCRLPMGTNCAPLLDGLFSHSYEAEFVQELLRKGEKKLTRSVI